jgi:biopolymer transport protein ExbD
MAAAPQTDERDDLISSINVTPLVDVFLVLLVIFMVTASFFLEQERRVREIPLTLPTAYSGVGPRPSPLNVLLDREGRLYLNGTPSDTDSIGREIDARKTGGAVPDVVVSADKDLPYGRVAKVIDFLKGHGIGNLAINVEEQTIAPPSPP